MSKEAKGIIAKMAEEMPFELSGTVKPYLEEALDLFANEQTQPLKNEIKDLNDKIKVKTEVRDMYKSKMDEYYLELKEFNTWVSVEELPDDKYLGVKFLCKIETITGEEFQICEWFNDDIEGEPSRFLIDCGWPMTHKKLISYKTINT